MKNPKANDENAWFAYAQLDDDQIKKLAQTIVREIKKRAKLRNGSGDVTPALTMGQFANRMITGEDDEVKRKGILQAAIEKSKLNETMDEYGTFDSNIYGSFSDQFPEQHPFSGDGGAVEIPLATTAPTAILQSDILQALGAAMTARSDTFIIRAYGDSVDSKGVVRARAWCEAVVQRVPTPVQSDVDDIWKPAETEDMVDFGRKFRVVSFKWLAKEEV